MPKAETVNLSIQDRGGEKKSIITNLKCSNARKKKKYNCLLLYPGLLKSPPPGNINYSFLSALFSVPSPEKRRKRRKRRNIEFS